MSEQNHIQNTSTESGPIGPATSPSNTQPDPEADTLRAENVELKRRLQMRDARDIAIRMLSEMGARSPELLFAAVRERLQFDDEGNVANIAALAEQLKREHPRQFAPRPSIGSIDGAIGSNSATRHLSAETLARMTPTQIQKLDWAEVRRVLSER